jgi:hypothetical protein
VGSFFTFLTPRLSCGLEEPEQTGLAVSRACLWDTRVAPLKKDKQGSSLSLCYTPSALSRGFFELGSCKLLPWAGLKPRSSLPPE